MILFGFEVDTLEIALREQLGLVDKLFIVESSVTHKGVSSGQVLTTDSVVKTQDLINKFGAHQHTLW